MTTFTQPAASTASPAMSRERRMPFFAQVAMLTGRAFIVNLRQPAEFIPTLIINVFFLLVYEGQLGGVAGSFLEGTDFLTFILPLTVASASLAGSSVAGQTIVADIARGYFDKLSLTPVSRWALLLGPMIAGAALVVLQIVPIILIALLMGFRPAAGIVGLASLLGFALLLGVAFSGLTVGVALLTGSAAATSGASFLFFPLSFLTATFVPVDQLQGWIKVAAQLNPITYTLEAMRATLNGVWDGAVLARGIGAALALFAVLFGFALFGLRSRTRRR
jgi:ABC-2 type transport system permease protein